MVVDLCKYSKHVCFGRQGALLHRDLVKVKLLHVSQ